MYSLQEPGGGAAAAPAKFELESPPSSATAEDAVSKAVFASAAEASAQDAKDLDNVATVSLSSPQASADADTVFKAPAEVTPPAAHGLSSSGSAAAAAGTAAGVGLSSSGRSTDADSTRPASSAGGLPLSATPASGSGRATPESTRQAGAWAAAAVAAAPAPPELPKASPVKVWVKDPEKQAERSRLGVALGSYVTCLVRTECSTACALAAGAPAGSAAAAGAAGGADSQPAQAQQEQQQQSAAPDGMQVFEVRRRFDDFDTLSRLLKAHFRGYFIPCLPPSEWLTAGDSYLRTRRVNLQDYLSVVANHPVLQGSDELQLFLTEPGDLAACSRWQHMLQRPAPMDALFGVRRADTDGSGNNSPTAAGTAAGPADGVSSAGGAAAGGGWGMMQRMRHSIMNLVQPKAPTELSAEEQQLRQAKESFKELQQHLSACVSAVRSLVGHMESLCEDYGELGRTLSHFARFEEALAARQGQYTAAGSSAVQRGADLQRLGYASLRQHSLSKQFVLSAGASLVFLPDYYALIPECVATLQEREDALAAVHVLAEQLRERQDAAAKAAAALGPAAAGDKRMVALNAAVQALQDKLLAAEQQYQLLKTRNTAELERLDLKRAEDFRRALGRFAALQAQTAAAAADVWSGVAEQFAS